MNNATRKQIKRDMKNNRIYAKRKKEVFCNKMIIASAVILWIIIAFLFIDSKASPYDTETQGTYIVGGHIERTTSRGYVVNVNDKPMEYKTDRFFPIGKMVSVEMDTNGTKENSDDFIAYIY